MAPSFPLFSNLPAYVQERIWWTAIKDQPPVVHFATTEANNFPQPRKKYLKWRKHPRPTVLEVLVHSTPFNFPPSWTAIDALRKTCQASRIFVLGYIDWYPERMLQLYRAPGAERAAALQRARGRGLPLHIGQPGGSRHADFPAPRPVDLPSSRVIDASQDLVIMRPPWHGSLRELSSRDNTLEWTVPIQRARYLAVFQNSTIGELTKEKMELLMFLRFRPEMLYIIVRPEFLQPDDSKPPREPKFKGDMWIEFAEAEWSLRHNLPPDQFWHWGKEYYALKWDDVVDLVPSCPNLYRLVKDMGEVWMHAKGHNCQGCDNPDCKRRQETRPVAWKIMTWRDHPVGA
ncbi:hypothetical protein ACJ41O_000670 [Fusarium nematophilum]